MGESEMQQAGGRREPRYRLYLCENCGRLGTMGAFQDECRPGWTHGRLHRVEQVRPEDHASIRQELRR